MSLRTALFAATLALTTVCAHAQNGQTLNERIITDMNLDAVPITARFSGSEILIFGAIARSRDLAPGEPEPDIVIEVAGPSQPIIVRKKARVSGVWTNREAQRIASAPSFFAIASTGELTDILRPTELKSSKLRLEDAVYFAGSTASTSDPADFLQAVLRLRVKNGLYKILPGRVRLDSATLFSTRIDLPANIVEGDYRMRALLVRGGRIVHEVIQTIPVRKAGLDRDIYVFSRKQPFLYGLAAVALALFTGWGASAFFRRLRR